MGLLDGVRLGEVLDENNGRINDCSFQKAKNLQVSSVFIITCFLFVVSAFNSI